MSGFIFKGTLVSLMFILAGSFLSTALGDPSMVNPLHIIGMGALVCFAILATIMAIAGKEEFYSFVGVVMSLALFAGLMFLKNHVQNFGDIISRIGKF